MYSSTPTLWSPPDPHNDRFQHHWVVRVQQYPEGKVVGLGSRGCSRQNGWIFDTPVSLIVLFYQYYCCIAKYVGLGCRHIFTCSINIRKSMILRTYLYFEVYYEYITRSSSAVSFSITAVGSAAPHPPSPLVLNQNSEFVASGVPWLRRLALEHCWRFLGFKCMIPQWFSHWSAVSLSFHFTADNRNTKYYLHEVGMHFVFCTWYIRSTSYVLFLDVLRPFVSDTTAVAVTAGLLYTHPKN